MRYSISISVVLLAAISVCSRAEETLWHPSQDAAWELTFEDNFEGSELNEYNWIEPSHPFRRARSKWHRRRAYLLL